MSLQYVSSINLNYNDLDKLTNSEIKIHIEQINKWLEITLNEVATIRRVLYAKLNKEKVNIEINNKSNIVKFKNLELMKLLKLPIVKIFDIYTHKQDYCLIAKNDLELLNNLYRKRMINENI